MGIFDFLKKQDNSPAPKSKNSSTVITSQTESGVSSKNYITQSLYLSDKIKVLKEIESIIPMIGAGIARYDALMGVPAINTGKNKTLQRVIDSFLQDVKVGYFNKGYSLFSSNCRHSLVLYGLTIGEAVVGSAPKTGVQGLLMPELSRFQYEYANNQGKLIYSPIWQGLRTEIEFNDSFIYKTAGIHNSDERGAGMLDNCQFIGDFARYVYEGMRAQAIKLGHPSLLVKYEDAEDEDESSAKATLESVVTQARNSLISAMSGKSRNIAVRYPKGGEVKISVVGVDSNVFDFTLHLQAAIEQISSAFSMTPTMLGCFARHGNYDMDKTMSTQLSVNVEKFREIDLAIRKQIIDLHLTLLGMSSAINDYEIIWPEQTLKDQLEAAKIFHLNSTALNNYISALSGAFEMKENDLDGLFEFLSEIAFFNMPKPKQDALKSFTKRVCENKKLYAARDAWEKVMENVPK